MDLEKYIHQNQAQSLESLKELIKINSEETDPVHTKSGEVYPFGQGVQDAFAYMLSLGESCGFRTVNVDNYGGHIEFGSGSEVLGIVGHLDVVPANDGWAFDPYSGEEEDGYILGRGTTDDKGPVMAAFYAMKALKDAGFQPARKVRLILGLDEENSWKGMDRYLSKVPAPDFGFTPDGDFPVIQGEKGQMHFELVKKLSKPANKGLLLSRLQAGTASNIVPDVARAVVRAGKETYDVIRQKAADYHMETGRKVKIRGVGKSLEILTEGKSCHAANPEQGLNAISVLFDFLAQLNFTSEDLNEFIEFYNKRIGFCLDGSQIGIGYHDEASGALTFNNGMLSYDKDSITLDVDVRFPVTADPEELYDRMIPYLDEYNLGIVKHTSKEPLYFPGDHPLISTLMDVYRDTTGDLESEPLVIGGGTYAKCCPNTVAFGALFADDPDLMHQRDEKIEVRRYEQLIRIYAEAIRRMAGEDFHLEQLESDGEA